MGKIHKLKPSKTQVEQAVRTLLSWAGDDPDRQGLKDTPGRVARVYVLPTAVWISPAVVPEFVPQMMCRLLNWITSKNVPVKPPAALRAVHVVTVGSLS